MRIEVDEAVLFSLASAVDRAVESVVAASVTDLGVDVALAMPGSRATTHAVATAAVFGDALAALARALTDHADCLREAGSRYDVTERAVSDEAVPR